MTSSARPVAALLAAFASAVPALPQAAPLQPATAAEYRKYAAKVESDMAAKARAGGFLWAPASTRVAASGLATSVVARMAKAPAAAPAAAIMPLDMVSPSQSESNRRCVYPTIESCPWRGHLAFS